MRTRFAIAFFTLLLTLNLSAAQRQSGEPVPLRNWPVSFDTGRLHPGTDTSVFSAPPANFVAVQPCRVVDTRNATGPFGGPMMGQGETRTYDIPAGPCPGIPSNASSYSLNFSVTGPAAQGFLTAWPAGATQPGVATMTWFAGNQTLSNGAIVPASASGAISVFSAATTHVIIDINGYFAGAGGINISTYAYPNPQSGSYSLTIPSAGVSRILVEALGGGGGGAYPGAFPGFPGQAGGSGGFARALIPVSSNTTITITLGAGGTGGTQASPSGTAGTDTTIAVNGGSTLLTAGGGGGGSGTAIGGVGSGGVVTGPTATFIQLISGATGNAAPLGYVGGSGGAGSMAGPGGPGQPGFVAVTFVQ